VHGKESVDSKYSSRDVIDLEEEQHVAGVSGGKLNYTRSVRFRVLTELSRLQCDADGADTYDGVHQHRFGRVAVNKLHQRQAWKRRWEWITYLESW
jgi:hypothetical protein